jgi:hypothetical protein
MLKARRIKPGVVVDKKEALLGTSTVCREVLTAFTRNLHK